MSDPCGQTPVFIHCHDCGTQERIDWLPMVMSQFIAAAEGKACVLCGGDNLRLGPRCSTIEERFPRG